MYFENYLNLKKKLSLLEFELTEKNSDDKKIEISKIKNSMTEIENELNKKNSDEHLFIRCRYINGYTMDKTAEAMNVSRDTAYRISRRVKDTLMIK